MAYRYTLPVFALLLGCFASSATVCAEEAVTWRTNLDAAKIEAAESNRLVLLHFYTKSCGPCRKLDKNVFSQPQVAQSIEKNYVPVKVDAESSPALRGAFRIERVPTEVIITPQGNQVASMGSPAKADEYVSRLGQVANHFRQTTQQLVKTSHQQPAQVNNAYANLQVAQPTPTSQPPAATPQAGSVAQVTQNPYVNSQTAPVRTQQAVAASVGSRYATQPAQAAPAVSAQAVPQPAPQPSVARAQQAQRQPAQPQMPANAMPQSYKRNPDAVNTQPSAQVVATQVPTSPQQSIAATTTPEVQLNATSAPQQSVASFVDRRVTPTADNSITPTPQGFAGGVAPAGQKTGTAPLGFDGYCPVSLKDHKKWVKGKVEHGIVHRNRLYLFASDEARQRFYSNPDKFSPVFSGCDPVLMLEQQQEVPGSRQFGYSHRGSFYLFANKITMQKFAQNPDAYSQQVRQAMTTIDSLQGGGIIRR